MRYFILMLLMSTYSNAYSESLQSKDVNPIIVSASKYQQSYNQSSSAITLISADDISSSNEYSLSAIISKYSSIYINQSGSLGSNQSVFMRGTESNHALVVIDGVEINDPSNPNRAASLNGIDPQAIERIEILKGSQAVLYGSDAIGGVINIITKKGTKSLQSYFNSSYGSYNTKDLTAGSSFSFSPMLKTSLGGGFLKSDGFSDLIGTSEEDGFRRKNAYLTLNFTPTNNFQAAMTSRFIKSDKEIDDSLTLSDQFHKVINEKFLININSSLIAIKGRVKLLGSYSSASHKRKSITGNSTYLDGQSQQAKVFANITPHDKIYLSTGLEFEKDRLNSVSFTKKSVQTRSAFMNSDFELNKTNINMGIRLDDYQSFGNHLSYKIGASHNLFDDTFIKSSFSTGLKAPSLSQLYDPTYGNPSTRPEEANSYELGLLSNSQFMSVEVTYFKTNIKDIFSYDSSFRTLNDGEARINGAELSLKGEPLPFFNLSLNSTYLFRAKKKDNSKLARRPKHVTKLALFYTWRDFSFTQTSNYTSSSQDISKRLESYSSYDLGASWKFNRTKLSLDLTNILNKNIEAIQNYNSPKRGYRLSVQSKF